VELRAPQPGRSRDGDRASLIGEGQAALREARRKGNDLEVRPDRRIDLDERPQNHWKRRRREDDGLSVTAQEEVAGVHAAGLLAVEPGAGGEAAAHVERIAD